MRARNIPGTLFMLVLAASQWRVILTLAVVLVVTAVGLRVGFGRGMVRPREWLARRLERRPVMVIERHYYSDQRASRSR